MKNLYTPEYFATLNYNLPREKFVELANFFFDDAKDFFQTIHHYQEIQFDLESNYARSFSYAQKDLI